MAMDTSPRTHRFLQGDLLTSGYRIVGKMMVTSQGVMGMLNDPTHSTMEVNDTRLARIHMPTKLVDHFDIVRLVKKKIHAVSMSRREDLGPQAIVRGGYGNIIEYPVRITTQMFEIEGILEVSGRFDFPTLMNEGARDFFPVFNATMTAILIPSLKVESAGILVNRQMVDMVALLNQRVKPENQP